jgi:hypothetical protein
MTFTDLIKILFIAFIVWIGWNFAQPYWQNYWIKQDLIKATSFATKNDIERARKMFKDSMLNQNKPELGEMIDIEKYDNGTVHSSLDYVAPVIIFGHKFTEYNMHIEKTLTNSENSMF